MSYLLEISMAITCLLHKNGIGYSENAFGGGFRRSCTIEEVTNDTMKIYEVCNELLDENHSHQAVRQVSVSITKLEDER